MPAPLMASIITGVTIAAVLFFVYQSIYQPPHEYAHQPTQCHAPNFLNNTCRRRRRRQDTCVICLELFNRCNDIVTLSCDHTLHKTCLQMMQAANHTRCPLCRGPLSYTS